MQLSITCCRHQIVDVFLIPSVGTIIVIIMPYHLGSVLRKHVYKICDHVWLYTACSATEVGYNIKIYHKTNLVVLASGRISKALIRLQGCAGWSAPTCCSHATMLSYHGQSHSFCYPIPHTHALEYTHTNTHTDFITTEQ